ncbi:ABC transporter ATP-binding protein [Aureitalea marina]|nr:ABC transporter ATP-binding protein [Aureitalea marina]
MEKYFKNFLFFYKAIGNRLFVALTLNVLVGILDGLGLAMFLPLLQMVSDNGGEIEGKSAVIEGMFSSMGLELNLFSVLLFMVSIFAVKGLIKFLSFSFQVIILQSFIRTVRIDMFDKFHVLNYKYFTQSDFGRLQNSVTAEVSRVGQACRSYLKTMEALVLVMTYLVLAFITNPQFSLLVTVVAGLTNFLYKFINRKTKGQSRILVKRNDFFQGMVLEYLNNFKYLKVSGKIQVFGERLTKGIKQVEETNKRIGILNGIALTIREPILIFVLSAVMLVQVEVLGGSLGLILLSIVFFYRALQVVLVMQNQYNVFLSVEGSLRNLEQIQREFDDHHQDTAGRTFTGLRSFIRLDGIRFGFGDRIVLNNIDLIIPENKTMAFVGPSGSGKTTLINLIAGLLSPDSGQILYDHKPIYEYDISSLQSRIGYITQEAVVFSDTLFNNISLWDKMTDENLSRYERVVQDAAMDEFVETDSAENQVSGLNLSGGQRQRVSIARELFKEPDILIMDEATSSLDSATEAVIQRRINEFSGKKTILIVAHRLSTVKKADIVVYLNAGNIEAQGTYEELMDTVPKFQKMVELQNL